MVGYGASALGNGAGSIAVAWLATELAPLTATAVATYTTSAQLVLAGG